MDALTPIGIGTADCESLSSYVQRLAAAHGTYPGQLVFRILAWLDNGEPEKAGRWSKSCGSLRLGFNNNSFSHADAWLRALQSFTRRADLASLTTRRWDHLFPTRGFQDSSLKWCPLCLAEDPAPYHRLAWTLQPVRVCIRHGTALQRSCTRCGKTVPVIHDRSAPTICPWCASDLRLTKGSVVVDAADFDHWCAREIGEIIRPGSQWHREIEWCSLRAVTLLASRLRRPSAAGLAKRIGTSKLTTWYWLSGKARPSLPMALRLYHAFDLSLSEHIFGPAIDHPPQTSRHIRQKDLYLRPSRSPRVIDWASVSECLATEAQRSSNEARTLLSIAAELRISRRTLRSHEPQLCRVISQRQRQRRTAERAERDSILAADLARILTALATSGIPQKWANIEEAMRRPGLLNSHHARRALKQALSDIFRQSRVAAALPDSEPCNNLALSRIAADPLNELPDNAPSGLHAVPTE